MTTATLSRTAIETRILSYLRHDYADAAGRASYFAEDATFEDPVGMPPVRGRDAIEATLRETVASGWRSLLAAEKIIVAGREAAAFVTADVSRDGKPVFSAPVILTFLLTDRELFGQVRCFVDLDAV